ncbi:MAG: immunoglobulin domain-containing protein [Phycisphaerae bacterium]|jgi:hypothetical protein|nr:immunoglobulin domain-containing protein [Phycisphaerae bacterium]
MKTMLQFFLILSLLAAPVWAAVPAQVLFSDTFDRPNNTDIDASSAGMSGPLAPMIYQEVWEGSGLATSIQILSNQLNIAMGPGMSSLFLDHNFIDNAILEADGFSVSLTVVSITSADDQPNRFAGFGVGNTRDEAMAAKDSFDSLTPFRPNTARANQGIGVSDFFADIALDQNLRIWSNGNLLQTIPVGAAAGTIRVDFLTDDFNAGSTVKAVVYFNGTLVTTQSFTWDHTNANYLGISGRTPAAGIFLDNLVISTVYEDRANQPYPADGEKMVLPTSLVLHWNKGKDSSGNPNPAIIRHYLYIAHTEPNFASVSPIIVPDTPDPVSYGLYSFSRDKVYYWRVDESILVGGTPSGPHDPNTITGWVWSFDTYTFPIITRQPTIAVADIGAAAQMECQFTSATEPSIRWFKTADPDQELSAGGRISIELTPLGQTQYRSLLTISDIQIADEGTYYCLVENSSGSENAVASATAAIGVRRLVGHWTLDAADYQNGLYLDSSSEGRHGEPNLPPAAGSFVNGVDPAETGQGLDLTVQPLAAAEIGRWNPYEFTGQMTLSLWAKWNGINGAYQGLITKREFDNDNLTSWYWEFSPEGNINFSTNYTQAATTPAPAAGQWAHLAVTVGPQGAVLYVNGVRKASNATLTPVRTDAPIFIGSNNRKSGILVAPFNGTLDDVRIYNYAMTPAEIVDVYYDVLEIPICLNLNQADLSFDIAGGGPDGDQPDCVINLADFAVFMQHWLECGLYPQSDCN